MSEPLLSFEQVSYRYPGSERAGAQRRELAVAPGEFCLLAGLSGAASPRCCAPPAGSCRTSTAGASPGASSSPASTRASTGPRDSARSAGALFQDPETQLVMSTVHAELALALESRGHGAAAVARGVEEVALALGIDALLERSTHELSGGEQQRVALGAALAGRPRLVLLDEPTSQLDPVAGDELIGLLRRLNQEWETTIVLAEHRLERCLSAADRVIAIDGGRVGCDGDPQAFSQWAARHAPALQTPGAQAVLARGPAIRRRSACGRRARRCARHALLPAQTPTGRRPSRSTRRAAPQRAPRRGAQSGAGCARAARRLARAARRAGDPARRRGSRSRRARASR